MIGSRRQSGRLNPARRPGSGLLVALLLVTFGLGMSAAAAEPTCAAGSQRLVGYHFIVAGENVTSLAGVAGPGEPFTLVAVVAACGGPDAEYSAEFELPSCRSPLRPALVRIAEGLNSDDARDDAERALVADLKAAMACPSASLSKAIPLAIAGLTLVAVATLGGMFVVRNRPR